MAKDVYIVATPPTGVITQIGSDYGRGVWVEDASWGHSLVDKGALRAQFTLRRKPDVEWPDLQAFTPIVIHKAGSVAWSGRVQETPTIRGRENEITVQCEGWPAHLKDDALRGFFVHENIGDWLDVRTKNVSLATWLPGPFEIDTPGGFIRIAVPSIALGAADQVGGIVYDAGPFNTIAQITPTWLGGGIANMELRVGAGDTIGTIAEAFVIDAAPISTVSVSTSVTFATPRRYVYIYMRSTAAAAAGATNWAQITDIILFGSTSYASAGLSVLKASQVMAAVLPYAPKVSQSTTKITTTSFNIPHLVGPVTSPSDYIDAANAYHLYQSFLRDDSAGGSPQLVFQPVPTSPTIVANVGDDIVFEDASRNDGGDIYNRVVVDYTDAAGNPALEERTTANLANAIADPDIVFDTTSVPQPTNPGFETAGGPPVTGWTSTVGGGITRDLAVFDTGVASALISSSAGGATAHQTVLSGLTSGRTYRVNYRVRTNAAWAAGTMQFRAVRTTSIDSVTGAAVTLGTADSFTNAIGAAFTSRSFTFTADSSSVSLQVFAASGLTASANICYIDNLVVLEARPTIIDRQNFTRTRVLSTGSRLTAAAADQIGDIFLQAHRATPLRGTLTVQGAALHVMQGDVPIPGHLVYRKLGEAVLINETDPDLGSIGRVGIISNVAYDESSDTVTVAIDNRKDYLDALFARLSVFTGNS